MTQLPFSVLVKVVWFWVNLHSEFLTRFFNWMCAIYDKVAVTLLHFCTNLVFLFQSLSQRDWMLHQPTCHIWIRGSHCTLPIINLFWVFSPQSFTNTDTYLYFLFRVFNFWFNHVFDPINSRILGYIPKF